MKGYNMDENVLVINRELTELDIFLKDFLQILKKYSDYLVVSGFVSISTGRTRGTEDIDIIVPLMKKDKFQAFVNELLQNNFWCYQSDNQIELYKYISELKNIRFARKDELFPNIKFISFDDTKLAKKFEFEHPQNIKINNFEFKIPPIEFEILYKEIVLGSEKDIADAKQLRTFFKEILKEEKFKEYEPIIKKEMKKKKWKN